MLDVENKVNTITENYGESLDGGNVIVDNENTGAIQRFYRPRIVSGVVTNPSEVRYGTENTS